MKALVLPALPSKAPDLPANTTALDAALQLARQLLLTDSDQVRRLSFVRVKLQHTLIHLALQPLPLSRRGWPASWEHSDCLHGEQASGAQLQDAPAARQLLLPLALLLGRLRADAEEPAAPGPQPVVSPGDRSKLLDAASGLLEDLVLALSARPQVGVGWSQGGAAVCLELQPWDCMHHTQTIQGVQLRM